MLTIRLLVMMSFHIGKVSSGFAVLDSSKVSSGFAALDSSKVGSGFARIQNYKFWIQTKTEPGVLDLE